jgi:hypothetical protein
MANQNESSAYPEPNDFAVMRPTYRENDDGMIQATIEVSPFKVTGESASKAGARRAALYEAQKTYRSYHPSFKVKNPYPDHFKDHQDVEWRRVPRHKRSQMGDYIFVEAGEEDYVNIETMLMWDVRPDEVLEEA